MTTVQTSKTSVFEEPAQNAPYTITLDKSYVKRNITHYAALFLWIGWMSFYLFFSLSLPFLWLYAKGVLAVLVGAMVMSALLPIDRKLQPQWGYNLGIWATKKAVEYFRMKNILEDKQAVETSGPAIFAIEPHHVLPLSIVGLNDSIRGFSGHKSLGCITSICFKIPLMRHMYTWINAYSVDKKDMLWMLRKGISPVMCPGGVQEASLLGNEEECVLYLTPRVGFIKLAIQFGYPVIPVFTFGLHNTFSFWIPKNDFCLWFGRKFGALPMMFFGVFGLPMGPAKPCDYVNVVGKPISMPKNENPSEEELKKYQQLYIDEITRIYHQYRADYGMKDIQLRIV